MIREAKVPAAGGTVPVVEISDVSPDIFEHILHFIYVGDCTLTSSSQNRWVFVLKPCHFKARLFSLKIYLWPLGHCFSSSVKEQLNKKHLTKKNENDISGRKNLIEDENDLSNPLTQVKAAAKKLGLSKLVNHLNCMRQVKIHVDNIPIYQDFLLGDYYKQHFCVTGIRMAT